MVGANPKQRLVRPQVIVDLQAIPVRRPERNPTEKNISRRVEEDGGVNTVVRRRLAAYTAANEQPADTMVLEGSTMRARSQTQCRLDAAIQAVDLI